MPEHRDANDTSGEPGSPRSPTNQDPPPAGRSTSPDHPALSFSLQFGRQLPNDVLSPETVERLRSGGALSAEDLKRLQSAAGMPGLVGSLLETALPTSHIERGGPEGADVTAAAQFAPDTNVVAMPGSVHRFEWTLGGKQPERDAESEPATYYEALTGRPDPMRGFFVTTRRVLNVVTWVIALGVPVGLVTLGVVLGESTETIVIMGIAGLIVGMMFKVSFPRTPFG